jgi:hypothetical protein
MTTVADLEVAEACQACPSALECPAVVGEAEALEVSRPQSAGRLGRAPTQPTTALTLYGGIYALSHTVKDAGTILPQHSHTFPHLSAIMAGAVRVEADGLDLGTFEAPAFVKIAARTRHTFTTLQPDTVICCLHAVGEAEGVDIHAEHHLNLEE